MAAKGRVIPDADGICRDCLTVNRRDTVKRGVILDVDGTLWDAVRQITDSWNTYTRNLDDVRGRISYEQMTGCLGKTMTQIADILFSYLPEKRRREVLTGAMKYENEYLVSHPGRIYPHVAETINALRDNGWSVYIVSNCQKGYIEVLMRVAGIADMIDDHICFEDTMRGKAENISLCCERNGIDKAVYVGDTLGDLEAARQAGTAFIFAEYGFGHVDEKDADGSIGSFAELAGLLENKSD